jgi:hypothetical protein
MERLSQWWDLFLDRQFDLLRTSVGPIIDEMRGSRSAAIRALGSCDARIRDAAIFTLQYGWESTSDVANLCERLIASDGDDGVKTAALRYVAAHYAGSADSRVAEVFARLVVTESDRELVREAAYRALVLVVKGKHLPPREPRFPRGVNWRFVRRYLRVP